MFTRKSAKSLISAIDTHNLLKRVYLTLNSVLRTQRGNTTHSADHEVLEQLVAGLATGAVVLEAGDGGGVLLARGAAGEGGVVVGVRGRGISICSAVAALSHGGRGAQGGSLLARRVADQRGGGLRREGHYGGDVVVGLTEIEAGAEVCVGLAAQIVVPDGRKASCEVMRDAKIVEADLLGCDWPSLPLDETNIWTTSEHPIVPYRRTSMVNMR